MHFAHNRVAFRTSFLICALCVACTATVDAPDGSYEREESAATADPKDSDQSTPPSGTERPQDSDRGDRAGQGGPNAVDADANPIDQASANEEDAGSPIANADGDGGAVPAPEPTPEPVDPEAASLARGAGLYPPLCAGCHGDNGLGGRTGVALDERKTFDQLVKKIDDTMPRGDPSACNRSCAEDLSRYILATFVN